MRLQTTLRSLHASIDADFQMHTLSATYFAFRHFWGQFLPLLCLSSTLSVLSFIAAQGKSEAAGVLTDASSGAVDALLVHVSDGDPYALAAGLLGVLVTFGQTVEKFLRWQSRAEQHRNAREILHKMEQNIRHELSKLDSSSVEDLETLIDRTSMMFQKVQESCSSPFPSKIEETFQLLEAKLTEEFRYHLHLGDPENATFRLEEFTGLTTYATYELRSAISNYRSYWCRIVPLLPLWWPISQPHPQKMLRIAFDRVKATLATDAKDGMLGLACRRRETTQASTAARTAQVAPEWDGR